MEAILVLTSEDCIYWRPVGEFPSMAGQGPRLDDFIMLHYDHCGPLYVMGAGHYDMYGIERNLKKSLVLKDWTLDG